MKKRLDVFLSSDQDEFKKERKELANRICKIPFLECTPLEERGASYEDVRAASIKASRKCDIFVGLFGQDFSELSIEEFKEAWIKYKPCLAYVKRLYKTEKRDDRLEKFIANELKSKVKYYAFRGKLKLYEQVSSDLENLLLDILQRGLENVNQSKREAQQLAKERELQLAQRAEIPEEEKSRQLIEDGMKLVDEGKNLAAIISATVSIEHLLKKMIMDAKPSDRNRFVRAGLGILSNEALNIGLIGQTDYSKLQNISFMRNKLLHEGYIPNSEDIDIMLINSQKIINDLSKIEVFPGYLFTDDFESDEKGSPPIKWETIEEKGKVRISNQKGGAEGTDKFLTISGPFGSRDIIRRKIKPKKKIDITYYIRQEIYGSSGVGAGLHLFYENKEAVWLCIVSKVLKYYDVKHNSICPIELGKWYKIQIKANCTTGTFRCLVNDELIVKNGNFRNKVPYINMISSTGWNRQDLWSTSIDQIKIR